MLLYSYDSGTGQDGVSDEVTKVEVGKLDADTHEYLSGATMAIIDKETGTVMMDWVSGSSQVNVYKVLYDEKTYILRELSAPEGYEKAADTEFVIGELGDVTITSGDDAELAGKYLINLYDEKTTSEVVTTVTNRGQDSTTTSMSGTSLVVAPKTGDETPLALVAALVAAAVAGIVVLQFAKRRIGKKE